MGNAQMSVRKDELKLGQLIVKELEFMDSCLPKQKEDPELRRKFDKLLRRMKKSNADLQSQIKSKWRRRKHARNWEKFHQDLQLVKVAVNEFTKEVSESEHSKSLIPCIQKKMENNPSSFTTEEMNTMKQLFEFMEMQGLHGQQ